MLKTLEYEIGMKIGYGYRRSEQSFRKFDCENVWIDRKEERFELAKLMGADGKDPAIRAGETLVLLQHADIGDHWKSRKRVLQWMAANGIYVQVRDGEAVLYDTQEKLDAYKALNGGSKTQVDAGRPYKIKWTADKAKEFADAWYGPFSAAYVRHEFERITGRKWGDAARNHCNNFYGPRDGSRKVKYNRFVGCEGEE